MSEITREITLDEAKKLYNSSEEAKVFLLSKFTKDELEGKNIPTQEEFNKFVEENIFTLIDYSKTRFLIDVNTESKTPTSRIELNNSDDEFLFDYDYNNKNQHFYYSYDLMKHVSLQDVDRHILMKGMVEKYFGLHECTPVQMRCGWVCQN